MVRETITFQVKNGIVERRIITRFGAVYLTRLPDNSLGLMFPKYLTEGVEFILPRRSHSVSHTDLSSFKDIASFKGGDGGEFVFAEYMEDLFFLSFSVKKQLVLGGWLGPSDTNLEGIEIALDSSFGQVIISSKGIMNLRFEGGMFQLQKKE